MGLGVPMDQGSGPRTPAAAASRDEASADVKIQDAMLESGMLDFDELDKVELERASQSAAATQSQEPRGKPDNSLQRQLQMPEIWGLGFGDDLDEAVSQWHENSRDGNMALVRQELELEAEAERRRRPTGNVLRGVEGKKIVIPTTWSSNAGAGRQQSKNAGADGKQGQEFFCELLIDGLIRIYKLLVSVSEEILQSIGGAWTLRPRLMALELLLAHVVPFHFTLEALPHCERIITLISHPERSLHALIAAAFQPRVPLSKSRSLFSQTPPMINELEDEVIRLADCLLDARQDVLEVIDAAKNVVLAARGMTPEIAEGVYQAKYALRHHLHNDWDVVITRTDPVAISCLLYDLRAGFQAEEFQNRYKDLRSKARYGRGAHAEMVQLTFLHQQSVLPRYGFPPTRAGVQSMRKESGIHADSVAGHMSCGGDQVVAKLRRDIHMCLDMDVKKHARLPLFHTVGDSHSMFGWPESVIQHAQGPLLCYNVDRVDLSQLDPPVRVGDAVCLCFGEIDCRCHVHKHCTAEKKYQEVIDEIIARYFNHLESQMRLLPARVKIFVYNVPPPVRRCDTEENPAYPYLGKDEERQAYVLYFNEKLKAACHKSSVRFFDVYDQYVDEEGFLSKEYSDGNVHIADGMWIEEVIHQLQLRPFRPSEINFDS